MSVTASSDAVPATEVLAEARAVGASQRGRLRTPVDIEVVIPAYNESARLPETLRQSVAYLDRQPWRSRLVVVDNGRVDETAPAPPGGVDRTQVDALFPGGENPVRPETYYAPAR